MAGYFYVGASVDGYNPCDRGVPVTAVPTIWIRIKVLAGRAARTQPRDSE